jgi:hypothetical protein
MPPQPVAPDTELTPVDLTNDGKPPAVTCISSIEVTPVMVAFICP